MSQSELDKQSVELDISKVQGVHDGNPAKSSVEGLGDLEPKPNNDQKSDNSTQTRNDQSGKK